MVVKQSIRNPTGVTVFGSSVVRVEPDRATIACAVARTAEKPAEAFEQARMATHSVRGLLAQMGVADRDVETSRITLEQAFEGYGEHRKFMGYRTWVRFNVLVRAVDATETVLVGLVDAGANVISEVRFVTSRLAELRAEARRNAVLAARRKAKVYAGAAGARVGPVLHIEDVNPEALTVHQGHGVAVDLTESDSEDNTLGSGSIAVTAAVMVSFALVEAPAPSQPVG